jgi:hypothetical protein
LLEEIERKIEQREEVGGERGKEAEAHQYKAAESPTLAHETFHPSGALRISFVINYLFFFFVLIVSFFLSLFLPSFWLCFSASCGSK